MKTTGFIFPLLLLLTCVMSCSSTSNVEITQGIVGEVIWFEGNLMPGPGKKQVEGMPIKREVHIYEATKGAEDSTPPFYQDLTSTLKAKVLSDENGLFKAKLPPGTYSVLVGEENGLFASIMDGEGILNPVTVHNNEVTEIVIKVDYKAAY